MDGRVGGGRLLEEREVLSQVDLMETHSRLLGRQLRSLCFSPPLLCVYFAIFQQIFLCMPRIQVLAQAASMVRMELKKDPNTLFLVGTYSIGKEKVLEAVARAAGSR